MIGWCTIWLAGWLSCPFFYMPGCLLSTCDSIVAWGVFDFRITGWAEYCMFSLSLYRALSGSCFPRLEDRKGGSQWTGSVCVFVCVCACVCLCLSQVGIAANSHLCPLALPCYLCASFLWLPVDTCLLDWTAWLETPQGFLSLTQHSLL